MFFFIKHEGMRCLFWISLPRWPHCAVLENSLGFVYQFCNQKLVGTDGTDGQPLHIRKQDTFHLYKYNNSRRRTQTEWKGKNKCFSVC